MDDRVVGELGPLPAAVAVHRVVAAADGADRARRGAASARAPRGSRAPTVGSVSRPSVNACTTRSGTPSWAASSMQASMCSQPECTPPSETRPIRCRRPRGLSRAAAQAASSASFSKKLPSAIASSIRARSCLTTAPAPRFRWPTSELPIWPSGRPTSRPLAESGRVRVALPELVEDRRRRLADGVARPVGRQAPAVEDRPGRRRGRAARKRRRRSRSREPAHPSAASQIARKSSGSRRRRRPGRRRCPGGRSSSAALAGLTEPP